jgi:predicted CXXCH cytochrome family protein
MKKMASQDAHPPVARGQCLTCHASHGSENAGMTRRAGASLCLSCHSAKKAEIVARHPGMDLEKAACTSCHDPHVQPKGQVGLLLPAKHLPFARGECTSCHVQKGAAQLVKTGSDLCITCHDRGGWVGRKNTHLPVTGNRQCLNCHGAHGGVGTPDLNAVGDQLCFNCHDRKGFEGPVIHPAMQKGCVTCHDPHGSDGPRLMKERSIEDQCRKCHADMSKHYHKTSSDRPDPSGRPLTCTSCHPPHAAKYEGLLIRDAQRDLCIQCHDPSMGPMPHAPGVKR